MEQFSRECLEIETKVDQIGGHDLTVGASMDRVYDRAAKLVKRTLDVEGVIVLDVSHCEVLETMSAEGAVSVIIHNGDPRQETTTRSLSQDEYSRLTEFFSVNPDGKISEGIVPPCFRPFLPTHIQYALSETLRQTLLIGATDSGCDSCSYFQRRQAAICAALCIQWDRAHQSLCKHVLRSITSFAAQLI